MLFIPPQKETKVGVQDECTTTGGILLEGLIDEGRRTPLFDERFVSQAKIEDLETFSKMDADTVVPRTDLENG